MQIGNLSEKDSTLFKKWLKGHLKIGLVTVTFTKKDGTERVMKCTTAPLLVPVDVLEGKHYTNTDNPIDFPVPKKEKKVNGYLQTKKFTKQKTFGFPSGV
jgi:hypothetical protein